MPASSTHALSSEEEQFVRTMQLLGDGTRFQIYKLIAQDGMLCVSEIADKLGISTSAVSQHFKLFEENDIVTRTREGQRICYKLKAHSKAARLLKLINKED